MKRSITLLAALLMLSYSGYAQEDRDELEAKLAAMKMEYIQARLDLSESKLKEFSGLYEKYEAEKKALKREMSKQRKAFPKRRNLSYDELNALKEDEAAQLLRGRLEQEAKLLELERKYMDTFTSTISAKQVLLYQQAEKEFRKDLIKAMVEERKESQQQYSRRLNERMRKQMMEMRQQRMKQAEEMRKDRQSQEESE